MKLQIDRPDLVIAAMLGALLTILTGHFSPAARTVEMQRDVAIVIPAGKTSPPRDPDAGAMEAEPDHNNWDPRDGQSRYGDKSAPDNDEDDDDDLDDSYDPVDPPDTTPI